MKRIFLGIMIIMLVAATACTSSLTQGDRSSDGTYAFTLLSAQIVDKIHEVVAPEEEVFLVIKYEVENLRNQDDSFRLWVPHLRLETNQEYYSVSPIETLDGQMWETSLLKNEKKEGYMAYMVPEDIHDFKLTFSFPASETKAVYDIRPVDKRIGVNADYVLTRLEQIERTRRIWLIGKPLAAFSKSPVRYLGTVLVPHEEISGLLEKTEGLSEDTKRAVVEDYLIAQGLCRLE